MFQMRFYEHEMRDMEKHTPLAVITVYDLNFSCGRRRLNIHGEGRVWKFFLQVSMLTHFHVSRIFF